MQVFKNIRSFFERGLNGVSKADSEDFGMYLAKMSLQAMSNLEDGIRFKRLVRFAGQRGPADDVLLDWDEAKKAFQSYISTVPDGSTEVMHQRQLALQQGLFYLNRVQDYLWT